MTTLREAAQQALEALEYAEANHGGDDCYADSITALRAALAEPEDDALTAAYMLGRHDSKWCPIHQHYKWCEHNGGVMGPTGWEKPMQQGCQHCNQPLYAAVKCRVCGRVISAEPVQEPVAWLVTDCIGERYLCFSPPLDNDQVLPLYAAPPQSKPLTDEEIRQIALDTPIGGTNFARAIERAHGIT